MSTIVFFSWQSDARAAACRSLIQGALEGATATIGRDPSIGIDAAIDRDTQDVPGCPDIGATIFAKIDAAAAFVADVTIVGRTQGGRPTPNPNVLIELGYALKALGDRRIILVQNTAFGGPELLPFDLRQKRVTTYSSLPDAAERAPERRMLQGALDAALRYILGEPSTVRTDATVDLTYVTKNRTQKLHQYEFVASIRNTSDRRLDDWAVEIEFPTPLVEPGVVFAAKVNEQSDAKRSLFRMSAQSLKQPLQFGQTRELRIGYRVDEATFWNRDVLFDEPVIARGFVDGRLVSTTERRVRDLQCF